MHELMSRTVEIANRAMWLLRSRLQFDERGGGRNTDEGMHISGGAILAGTVLTLAGAYVAKKLGALG